MNVDFTTDELLHYRRRKIDLTSLGAARQRVFGIDAEVMNQPENKISEIYEEALGSLRPTTEMEKLVIRLHVLCTVGHIDSLRHFIEMFARRHGPPCVELLLNSHMMISVPGRRPLALTPLLSVLMWNDSPQLVRLLYSWGAALHDHDEQGLFPEEKLAYIPYFCVFSHSYALQGDQGYFALGRLMSDFTGAINEVLVLSGEMSPPQGWVRPLPMGALN